MDLSKLSVDRTLVGLLKKPVQQQAVAEQPGGLSKLEALERRQRQLTAQIEREQAKAREQARKADTRRKIVLGGTVLKAIKEGAIAEDQVYELLDQFVKSSRDRKLFNLET